MLHKMPERSTKFDVQQKGILNDNNGTTNRLFNWADQEEAKPLTLEIQLVPF